MIKGVFFLSEKEARINKKGKKRKINHLSHAIDYYYFLMKLTLFRTKDKYGLKVIGLEKIFHANRN